MANPLLLAALEYEAKGFSIIPLKPKDKIPLVPSWTQFQVERADREQLGAWWRLWPDANIGLVTGSISGGTYVVDTDSPEAATAIKQLLGSMDDVGIVSTGKGFHLYYWHDGEALANKAGIRPQVDFRGDGGYVVAPPSVHSSGKQYQWVKPINGHLRPLPEEFLALLKAGSQANLAREKFDTAAALAGIPEGMRDQEIFKLASKLRGADVPYEVAIELCEQAAANCSPPFREARRKVDQAYKYSPGRKQQQNRQLMPAQEAFWPEPIKMEEFRNKKLDPLKWIWDQALSFGSVSMIAGQPRHGKSSFALNLALAVSRGADFMNRPTAKARAWYISIDNSEEEMRDMLDKIGTHDPDDLLVHHGPVPENSTVWACEMIKKYEIKFVVIDTLQRFFSIKNINDSEECKSALEPMDFQVKQMRCHVMYLHHAGKAVSGNLTGMLGSNVIKGMCPFYFEMVRLEDGQQRVLSSDFRVGKNFDKTYVKIDPRSGWVYDAGGYKDAILENLYPLIFDYLTDNPSSVQADIMNNIPTKHLYVSLALRQLYKDNKIERTGSGKRGDAFRYSIPMTTIRGGDRYSLDD